MPSLMLCPDILTSYEVPLALGVMLSSGQCTLMVSRSMTSAFPKLTALILGLVLHISKATLLVYGQAGRDADPWGFDKSTSIRICGRHVPSIWRAMRNELNPLNYDLVFHLLSRR